jgi:HK97 family phage prohead protease
MSAFYQYKNIPDSVKDVDSVTRRVKVAISHTGSLDLDKDIIEASAFNKTIKERGPKGSNLIWHLTDHNPSLKSAVGKFSELFMEGNYLVGVTDIPNTTWGNDVLEFYKSGHINQHSIGFSTVKREVVNEDDWNKRYTIIKEVMLYEGSAVLWGANPNTPTLDSGKSINKEEEAKKLTDELDKLMKSMRNGNYTDNAFELIETRIKQIQQSISDMFTQPAIKAVEPMEKEAAELIKQFTNNLNIK